MTKTVVLCEGSHRDGPYGVDLLPGLGFETSGAAPVRRAVAGKLRDVVEHRCGVRWVQAVQAWPLVRNSDLVLGLLEPSTEAALRLKARRGGAYARTALVLVSCWLAQWLRDADQEKRADLVSLYSAADLVLVLSQNQVSELVAGGFEADRVAAIPYGCAPWLFDGPELPRDLDVVAAGFDHGRDYETFFRGVEHLDTTVHVLCQQANLEGLRVPANVEVHGVVPYEQYRRMLRRAKIVAVPTREMAYPCGQSVALDAASAGATVAFTRTEALGEYLDGDCAAPVAVGDAQGWHHVLRHLLEHIDDRERLAAAGRRRVRENFTVHHMWEGFRDVLAERNILREL